MTRFMQEISGELGEWWKNHAEKELAEHVEKAKSDANVDANGAISWKCNGRYLMDDYCEMLEYAGFDFSRKATEIARDKQNEESIAEYKRLNANRKYTDEEIFEMRAAFGPGAIVVDAITGKKIRL